MPEGDKKRGLDRLALLGAALVTAFGLVGAFWVAGDFHVSPDWVFGAGSGLLFFAVVGWGYRENFRKRSFIGFFVFWTLGHVALFLLVIDWFGLTAYFLTAPLELWIGYTVAILLFGPPRERPIR